jgi:hypothetical protein
VPSKDAVEILFVRGPLTPSPHSQQSRREVSLLHRKLLADDAQNDFQSRSLATRANLRCFQLAATTAITMTRGYGDSLHQSQYLLAVQQSSVRGKGLTVSRREAGTVAHSFTSRMYKKDAGKTNLHTTSKYRVCKLPLPSSPSRESENSQRHGRSKRS